MVAARAKEAMAIHPIASARARTMMVSITRNPLPRKMWAIAWEISLDWRLRNNSRSPRVTGRVFRYSKNENAKSSQQVTPKLQRQAISASPKDG
jgi:hypothetical protein